MTQPPPYVPGVQNFVYSEGIFTYLPYLATLKRRTWGGGVSEDVGGDRYASAIPSEIFHGIWMMTFQSASGSSIQDFTLSMGFYEY
jgi:hypothetical protein